MAKKQPEQDLVQVDIYLLPRPMAEMYRLLREVVAQEIMALLEERYARVERVQDAQTGETIVAYASAENIAFRYELSPTNISSAQQARDKDQLLPYLEKLGL